MKPKQITMGPTLVVLIGPSGGGKSTFASDNFLPEEVVSTDALRQELLGDFRRTDMKDVIFNEFDRRIRMRLELGLRVVADATHVRNSPRRRTARLAAQYGARVIYVVINRSLMAKLNHGGWRITTMVDGKDLITRSDETFVANTNTILSGDGGLAKTVIDMRAEVPDVVMPLNRADTLTDIKSRGYGGLLTVGDIHGNHTGLVKMIKLARRENLYMLFMGDIVDYATDTLKCADEVAEIVFRGRGSSVLGNHEKKIHKWVTHERSEGVFENLNGFTGDISHGNLVTVNQIKAMMPEDRFKWETRFIGLCATMPHMIRMPGYLFVHGAADRHMYDADDFRFPPESAQEGFAMYGQTTGKFVNGFPEREYRWVDDIPPRMTVVVGHDCRADTEPLIQQGAAGGRAIFLDTGSSKPDRYENGRLSAMALTITSRRKIGYVLENQRFYNDRVLD